VHFKTFTGRTSPDASGQAEIKGYRRLKRNIYSIMAPLNPSSVLVRTPAGNLAERVCTAYQHTLLHLSLILTSFIKAFLGACP
jgi:hypothetical protein